MYFVGKLPCCWSTSSLGSNKAFPTHVPFRVDSIMCTHSGHQASPQPAIETNFYIGEHLVNNVAVYYATSYNTIQK